MAPKPGTYVFQRDSDNAYLAVVGKLVAASLSDAYKWRISSSSGNAFYINDPVSGDYLYDNGTTGYLTSAVLGPNSEWTGLSIGPASKIYNKGTKKPLQIPYDGKVQSEWTLVEPSPPPHHPESSNS